MTSVLLLLLYAAAVAAVGAVARGLRRPIPAGALLVFALLPLAAFAEAFLGDRTILPADHRRLIPPWSVPGAPAPRNPDLNDAITQFAPWEAAARDAWHRGELPLRDRWNGGGAPLAANAISAVFSPVHLLGLALPLARAFTLIAAIHVLIAASGMWLLARELGVSPAASLFAAPAWGLSLAMTPWLLFPQTGVLSLWPWLLFLTERAAEARLQTRCAIALTALFAAMVLAGHPESLALGCVLCAAWLLLRAALRREARFLRALVRVAACGAAAAALVAWLLVPFLFALSASNRLAGLTSPSWARFLSLAPHRPAWPAGPLQLAFPFTYGDAIASPMLPDAPSAFPEIASGYSGIAAVVLALLVLRRGRRRAETLALLALALGGVLVAIGQWPFLELVSRIPLLRFVVPLRFLTWAALAIPLAAALELDRLAADAAEGKRPWRALAASGVAVAAGAFAWFALHRAAHAHAGGLAFQSRALTAACGIALALAAAAVVLRRRPAALCLIAAALSIAELLVDARHLYRAAPSAELFPETPLVAFLRSRAGAFRSAGMGPALFPNTNVYARVQDARTHDPLERRDYLEFLDASCGYPPDEYFRMLLRFDCGALDFASVRWLVAAPGTSPPAPKWSVAYSGADGVVFENASALPRAFAPRRVRFAREVRPREAARIGDWTDEAVLEDAADRAPATNAAVRVGGFDESVNRVSIETSSDAPAIVVASLVQDGGWTARDGTGRALRTWHANGPFLAVETPAGDGRIDLTYSPPGFRAGLFVAAFALAAGAAWCLRRRGRVRSPAEEEAAG
ncbi:MAG TPA: hypothetical protein VH854_11485 [Thermoanaerobaculia bacterium]|nr:hypothetical protein [Thermoanaerobaculia bacterium]